MKTKSNCYKFCSLLLVSMFNSRLNAQEGSTSHSQKDSALSSSKGAGSHLGVTAFNVYTDLMAMGLVAMAFDFKAGPEKAKIDQKVFDSSPWKNLKIQSELTYDIENKIKYVAALKPTDVQQIQDEVLKLEELIKKLDDSKLKESFFVLKKSGSNEFLSLTPQIAEKKILIDKDFQDLFNAEYKKSGKIKFIKGVALFAGAFFVADAAGEIWAYFDDEPRPVKIPGKLSFDILKNQAQSIGPAIMAAIREKDLKTFLDERNRGTEQELLNETENSKPKDPSKKH